ncbi:hypothetical protein IE077_003909 [Cardiosporidium cionae]|uniref:Transmembrane protein n=1 Tax=Cardiosporidium cionae TaxID=476202 RepID=A0ABQ7J777_9APIC|nr:hypothetical protein IE077_003909 [Cardiosporidium cionae]|eukprot:KAF8819834.1 hypothetical protein IE077_003909 [Cardiosporidium cionae]
MGGNMTFSIRCYSPLRMLFETVAISSNSLISSESSSSIIPRRSALSTILLSKLPFSTIFHQRNNLQPLQHASSSSSLFSHCRYFVSHTQSIDCESNGATLTECSTQGGERMACVAVPLATVELALKRLHTAEKFFDLAALYELEKSMRDLFSVSLLSSRWKDNLIALENYGLQLKECRMEQAKLRSYGHMSLEEERGEVLFLALMCVCGAFGVGLHPIFFLGMLYGIITSVKRRKKSLKRAESLHRLKALKDTMKDLQQHIENHCKVLRQNILSLSTIPPQQSKSLCKTLSHPLLLLPPPP